MTVPIIEPPIRHLDDQPTRIEPSEQENWLMSQTNSVNRLMNLARLDWTPPHRQPSGLRVVIATIVSLLGSLIADAAIVAVGTRAFPSTKGYVHFQFSDYGKLTVIGVLIACAAWPVVTRISSEPRWLFFRLAILVTLVLWLPDVYILHQGQSGKAVATLMAMHLAIALVTYNVLVRIAPERSARRSHSPDSG
jgi:hypothetical protein